MLTLGSNQEVKDVNAKPIPPRSEAPFLIGVYFGHYQLKAVNTGVAQT